MAWRTVSASAPEVSIDAECLGSAVHYSSSSCTSGSLWLHSSAHFKLTLISDATFRTTIVLVEFGPCRLFPLISTAFSSSTTNDSRSPALSGTRLMANNLIIIILETKEKWLA
jgi:hypothetical protein